MTFIDILTTVVGIVMGCANFPQAYRIFKKKRSESISLITYSLLLFGSIVWIVYGIEKSSFPIIISNIIGVISISLVIFLTFKYRT